MNPQNEKYWPLYMQYAEQAAKMSVARRRQVGALVVLPTGLLAPGWNGTPSGFSNECEYINEQGELVTHDYVIHAERNAIDKLTQQGVSVDGAILFVTTAPCLECAKSIGNIRFKAVIFKETYRCTKGLEHLKKLNIPIYRGGSDDVVSN